MALNLIVWNGGEHDEAALLASCYQRSFEVALEHGVKSIAFPAISTGPYEYPKTEAAGIALGIMREFEKMFERVIACLHSSGDFELYTNALEGKMCDAFTCVRLRYANLIPPSSFSQQT
ncbi:MAG: macro domain-containing protein [Pseudomonadota bacterium]